MAEFIEEKFWQKCNICLENISGHQWGIIPVEIEAVEGLTNFYIEDDVVSFVVHPYCMNEAVECYTMELADGILENEYMLERKIADK